MLYRIRLRCPQGLIFSNGTDRGRGCACLAVNRKSSEVNEGSFIERGTAGCDLFSDMVGDCNSFGRWSGRRSLSRRDVQRWGRKRTEE